MIAALRRWIIRRRFERLFMADEPRLSASRAKHAKGAAAILKARRERVHAALRMGV